MTESAGAVMVRPALLGLQGHYTPYTINPTNLTCMADLAGEVFHRDTNLSLNSSPLVGGEFCISGEVWTILFILKSVDLHCAVLRTDTLG